jgi:hypothetical protein
LKSSVCGSRRLLVRRHSGIGIRKLIFTKGMAADMHERFVLFGSVFWRVAAVVFLFASFFAFISAVGPDWPAEPACARRLAVAIVLLVVNASVSSYGLLTWNLVCKRWVLFEKEQSDDR